jgi:hypothetical protein
VLPVVHLLVHLVQLLHQLKLSQMIHGLQPLQQQPAADGQPPPTTNLRFKQLNNPPIHPFLRLNN